MRRRARALSKIRFPETILTPCSRMLFETPSTEFAWGRLVRETRSTAGEASTDAFGVRVRWPGVGEIFTDATYTRRFTRGAPDGRDAKGGNGVIGGWKETPYFI